MRAARYVGIDPGDRWCGWACLRSTVPNSFGRRQFFASSMVLDSRSRSFGRLVKALMPPSRNFHVGVEQYQERNVGYRAWANAATPELVGGLRLLLDRQHHAFHRVSPSFASAVAVLATPESVEELAFMRIVTQPSNKTALQNGNSWDHARSAWRVLLRMVYEIDQPLLLALRKASSMLRTLQPDARLEPADLVSCTASWEM